MPQLNTVTDRDAANRYGLVVALLCLTYVVAATAEGEGGLTAVWVVQLATLYLTFSASESRRAQRIAGIACVALAVASLATWIFGLAFTFDHPALKALPVLSAILYLIAPAVILRHLIRRDTVDGRTILGGIAVYLMLGLMFSFTYRAISVWQPDPAFFGDAGRGNGAEFLFFSFITLTTTGYGDLVPAANPGQSVAVLEAIIGQLFLVTALAKIVNAWHVPGLSSPAKPAPDE